MLLPIDDRELSPLEKAILFTGGQKALGKAIGVSQPTIASWLRNRNGIPTKAESCIAIEKATKGRVKAKEFNAVLFG